MLDLSVFHGDGTNFTTKLGSDITGYSGHNHQKGDKIVAIQDHAGHVLAQMTVSAVNQSDMVLLTDALKNLKTTCAQTGIEVPDKTVLSLDA